jgi:uncharacterized repeat protein (TIGR03803 family)
MNKLSSWKTIFLLCLFGAATAIVSAAQITFKTLVSFNKTDGEDPYDRSLVEGRDGRFYGSTVAGGTNCYGTGFKITRGGVLTTLHNFHGTDGASPTAGL